MRRNQSSLDLVGKSVLDRCRVLQVRSEEETKDPSGGAEGKAGRVDAVRENDMEARGQGGQMQKIYTIRQVDRRRTMVHHKTAHHLDMQPSSHGHARYQPVYCSGVGESPAAAEGAGFRPTSAKVEQGHATPHSANRKSADMGSPHMDTICRRGGPVDGLGSEFEDGCLPGGTCLAQVFRVCLLYSE